MSEIKEYKSAGRLKGKIANYEGTDKTVYRFQINNNEKNRNGWTTITEGINYDAYLQNPVVLFNHDQSLVIGSCLSLGVSADKTELYAMIWFDELSELSKQVKAQVDENVLRATSIWIAPIKRVYEEEEVDKPSLHRSEIFTESDLLEISIVAVPANKDTLRSSKRNENIKPLINEVTMDKPNENAVDTKQDNIAGKDEKLSEYILLRDDLTKEKAKTEKLQTDYNELDKNTKETIEKLQTSLTDMIQKNLEMQVERDVASISSFLPANTDTDKLKKDLMFFLKSEYKDSDGKLLYDLELEKIKSNKNDLGYLTKPLLDGEQLNSNDLPPYNVADFLDPEKAAKLANKLDKKASEMNITYTEVFEKYRNGEL